jgi:omega-6 fatty acid desaturase (delta-12 desaturase)
MGIAAANLFEVGHEAVHMHFSGYRKLDRALAHLALLPILKPLSPFAYSHVQRHHRYTNIKRYDTQWSPSSPAEYAAFSRWRRFLERIYRHALGCGIYWSLEVVLPFYTSRGFYHFDAIKPSAKERMVFRRHRTLLLLYIAGNLMIWPAVGKALQLSPVGTLLAAFVCPVLIAHWIIGEATYLQHTAPHVRWFETKADWSFFTAQVEGTAELIPLHPIFGTTDRPHRAHHVDMSVSCWGLKDAQRALAAAYPNATRRVVADFATHLRIARRCKLYDVERGAWVNFEGNVT